MAAPITLESQAAQIANLQTAFERLHAQSETDKAAFAEQLEAQQAAAATSHKAFVAAVRAKFPLAVEAKLAPLKEQVQTLTVAAGQHEQVVTDLRAAVTKAEADRQSVLSTAIQSTQKAEKLEAAAELNATALVVQQQLVEQLQGQLQAAQTAAQLPSDDAGRITELQEELQAQRSGAQEAVTVLQKQLLAAKAALQTATQDNALALQLARTEAGKAQQDLKRFTDLYNGADTVEGSKAWFEATISDLRESKALLTTDAQHQAAAMEKVTAERDGAVGAVTQLKEALTEAQTLLQTLNELYNGDDTVIGSKAYYESKIQEFSAEYKLLSDLHFGDATVEGSKAYYQDQVANLQRQLQDHTTGAQAAVEAITTKLTAAQQQLGALELAAQGHDQALSAAQLEARTQSERAGELDKRVAALETELAQATAAAAADDEAQRLKAAMACMGDRIAFLEGRVIMLAVGTRHRDLIVAEQQADEAKPVAHAIVGQLFHRAQADAYTASRFFVPAGCYNPIRTVALGSHWRDMNPATYTPTVVLAADDAENLDFSIERAFPDAHAAGCTSITDVLRWNDGASVCPIPTGKVFDAAKVSDLGMTLGENLKQPLCIVELVADTPDDMAASTYTSQVLVVQHTIGGEIAYSFPEGVDEGSQVSQKGIVKSGELVSPDFSSINGVYDMGISANHLLDDRHNADNAWIQSRSETLCTVVADRAFSHNADAEKVLGEGRRSFWMKTSDIDPRTFMKAHQEAAYQVSTCVTEEAIAKVVTQEVAALVPADELAKYELPPQPVDVVDASLVGQQPPKVAPKPPTPEAVEVVVQQPPKVAPKPPEAVEVVVQQPPKVAPKPPEAVGVAVVDTRTAEEIAADDLFAEM